MNTSTIIDWIGRRPHHRDQGPAMERALDWLRTQSLPANTDTTAELCRRFGLKPATAYVVIALAQKAKAGRASPARGLRAG